MKITISIPGELEQKLRAYIKNRFGNEKTRALSLVIREAIKNYLEKGDEKK